MKRSFEVLAGVALCCALLFAQQRYAVEPPHDSGQGITAAYEGYFENSDGSLSLLFGYYNRNVKQEFDIPPGPDNRIEPGGPDRGQPTHFLTGRQWGVFTVTVPKGFNQKLTWTLTANGKTAAIPANLDPLYLLAPLKDATNNTPPFLGFQEAGPFVQGPRGQSTSVDAKAATPVPLTLWVADDAQVAPGARRPLTQPVTVSIAKYRGPGAVTFTPPRPKLDEAPFSAPPGSMFTAKASVSATFSEPGEYLLHVTLNDWSGVGGGGFQCCWTNGQIRVNVTR